MLNAGVLDRGIRAGLQQTIGAPRRQCACSKPKKALLPSERWRRRRSSKDIAALESDSAFLQAVTRRAFVERGLSLVDGPICPLCDTEWDDVGHLKKHLRAKLAKSKEGEALQQRLIRMPWK